MMGYDSRQMGQKEEKEKAPLLFSFLQNSAVFSIKRRKGGEVHLLLSEKWRNSGKRRKEAPIGGEAGSPGSAIRPSPSSLATKC